MQEYPTHQRGAYRLRQLLDTKIGAPEDGQLLLFDAAEGRWVGRQITATDVNAAAVDHNHDADYATTDHNHDADYAPLVHNHDDLYYTEAEVDTLLEGVGGGGTLQYKRAVGTNVATTPGPSFTDLQSLSVTLDVAGIWVVVGVFYFERLTSNDDAKVQGGLAVDGVAQTEYAVWDSGQGLGGTVSQTWIVNAAGTETLKLQWRLDRTQSTDYRNIGTQTTLTAFTVG